jgi:hypothetical protein
MLGSWNAPARADMKQGGIGKQFLPEQDVINLRFLKGSPRNQIIGAVVAGSLAACVSGHFNKTNIVSWQNLVVVLATGYLAKVSSSNIENYRLKTRRKKIEDAANTHIDEIFKPLSDLRTYSAKDILSVVSHFMQEKERLEPHSEQPYVVRFNLAGQEKIEHIFRGQFADRLTVKVKVSDFLDKLKKLATLYHGSDEKSQLSQQCSEVLLQPGFINDLAKDVFCHMGNESWPRFERSASVIDHDVFSKVQEPLYQILQNALIALSFLSKETDQSAFVRDQSPWDAHLKYGSTINGLASYYGNRFVNLVDKIPVFKERFEKDFGQEDFGRILNSIRQEKALAEDLCALVNQWSESRANCSGSEMANGIGSLPRVIPLFPAIHPPGERAR